MLQHILFAVTQVQFDIWGDFYFLNATPKTTLTKIKCRYSAKKK